MENITSLYTLTLIVTWYLIIKTFIFSIKNEISLFCFNKRIVYQEKFSKIHSINVHATFMKHI